VFFADAVPCSKCWTQSDVKTMVRRNISACAIFFKLLIFCKVVEIQLHLKVRAPCPAVQRMRIVTLLLQELYDYVSANSDRIHKNYIRARNLMSQ